jgi:6-phosphofructokinase 1
MSVIATGAERVYLPEEGVSLDDLRADLEQLIERFQNGRELSLMMRNENVNKLYTTAFMCALFEEEGKSLFDVRQAILGHLQQGGSPSPFDRIQATRLAAHSVTFLVEQCQKRSTTGAFIGLREGHVEIHDLNDMPRMIDRAHQRPSEQWWLDLRPVERVMATFPAHLDETAPT